jgi:hypothetical protein
MDIKSGKIYLVKHLKGSKKDNDMVALRIWMATKDVIEYTKLFAIDGSYVDTVQFFRVQREMFFRMYQLHIELNDNGDEAENYPYLLI